MKTVIVASYRNGRRIVVVPSGQTEDDLFRLRNDIFGGNPDCTECSECELFEESELDPSVAKSKPDQP